MRVIDSLAILSFGMTLCLTVESFSNHRHGLFKLTSTVQSSLNTQTPSLTEDAIDISAYDQAEQRRVIGSQENLMLPRQYSPNPDVTFPQMNHISCAILSSTPKESVLTEAINQVMKAHPLLQCQIDGDGEPDERIDLMNMVRKGEPNPCTFASKPGQFSAVDVLQTVAVEGDDRSSLDESWQKAFVRDLDDGSWCNVNASPLWKLEFHRSTDGGDGPCALLLSFNHAFQIKAAPID